MRANVKIGLLCDEKWVGKTIDNQLILSEYKKNGIEAEEVIWDFRRDYHDFSMVIVRSTWGYQSRYSDYKKCLKKIDEETMLVNSYDTIVGNIDKAYQIEELKRYKIDYIESLLIGNEEEQIDELANQIKERYGNSQIVLKPSISASGQDTICIDSLESEWLCVCEYLQRIVKKEKKKVIVQRFREEIEDGELSLIYIMGVFSHAVRRFPGVLTKKKSIEYIYNVDKTVLDRGNEVCEKLRLKNNLYARIDLLMVGKKPMVMEVELNEPDLFFRKCGDETGRILNNFVNQSLNTLKYKKDRNSEEK